MTETGVETQAGCPRWMKLALVVSLMLNVAIIGVVAGFNMKDKGAGSGNRQVDWILKLVPDERRDDTKAHFAEVRDELRGIRAERFEMLDRVVAVMRTEPFEADTFSAVLAERRSNGQASRAIVHERLSILLTEFTPAERAIFADRLEERIARWQKSRGN